MKKLKKFIPFVKVDEAKRQVWGIVTAEVPDKEDEVCDYTKSKPHYQAVIDEFSKATDGANFFPLREMHQLSAVGKCIGFEFRDSEKEIFMGFEVVDDVAWKKVLKRVYTGFSQGGTIVGDLKPDPVFKGCMRYVAAPSECSLVDNPCLGVSHFTQVKVDGSVEICKLRSIPLQKDDMEECMCSCAKCKAGNCDECTKVGCDDENCKSCPMQKVKKKTFKPERVKAIKVLIRKRVRVWVNKHVNNKSKLKNTPPKMKAVLLALDDELGRMNKGLREVSCLAQGLDQFSYLFWMICNEQEWEEDVDSVVPEMLSNNLNDLVDTLLAMVSEETSELKDSIAERLAATEAVAAAS